MTDGAVAVIGTGERGVSEAEFLRSYTADVTLIAPEGAHRLDVGERERLEAAGIRAVDGPCRAFTLETDRIAVALPGGAAAFTSIYPALGSDVRSELAVGLGAEVSQEGCVAVDGKQRATVPGLYAAGDVVIGLDQISNATGQGGIAATTIRNDLSAQKLLRR